MVGRGTDQRATERSAGLRLSPRPAPRTIFHAHHWSFARVGVELHALAAAGYDAVQLSPAQKSPEGDEWYLRYQPVDHLVIDGLGSRDDLAALCRDARALGMTVIADVVFNHMAVPAGTSREIWAKADVKRAAGDPSEMARLRAKLDAFPHLSEADFAPWRDMQGADWDNEHRYESWGNGEWPELIPTPKVLALHVRHLELLFEAGVRGFRFDAVKHMRVGQLRTYVDAIEAFREPCWTYGEVFSADPSMHREYRALFPTTDFRFVLELKQRIASGPRFTLDPKTVVLDGESIRFGTNHDLAYNPAHLVEGFLFADAAATRLANCLAVLLAGGTVLVLADDHERDPVVRDCVTRRHAGATLSGVIEVCKLADRWVVEAPGDRRELPHPAP